MVNKRGSNRRTFLKATSVGAIIATAGCMGGGGDDGGDGGNGSPTEWIISSSNEGSPVIPWIEGMASEVNQRSDTLELTPQNVNGWRTATRRLSIGDFDLSAFTSFFQIEAANEEGIYSEDGEIGPLDPVPVCVTPTLHQQNFGFCARSDSGIETMDDLEGELVGTNVRGSSVIDVGNEIRNASSVEWDWEPLSWSDLGSAMQEGRVDAAWVLYTNGRNMPAPLIQAFEAETWGGIDISDEVQDNLEDHEYLAFTTMNGDNMNVQNDIGELTVMDIGSAIFARPDAGEDLVYEYISIILDNQEALEQYDPAMELFGIGEGRHNFDGIPEAVEYHPGAVEYFEEEDIDYPGR